MSKLADIVKDIQAKYLADTRPWIIGFSGGKDSTALLQLVYTAVKNLPPEQRQKRIHVLCSDTGVEPPNIISFIDNTLAQVNSSADEAKVPIEAHKLTPRLEDRFFVKIIGRGYPAPNRWFRWCTNRLKIQPSDTYIKQKIQQHGEVIVLLGVRNEESATRSGSINRNHIEGSDFSRHTTLPNAFVYSPIKNMTTQEVWIYLVRSECPWGGNHRDLASLYRQAEGGKECPVVFDGSSPVCGGSRFGCWTCTVVDRDKSMEGFVESGEEWMLPLLEFRNWLAITRNNLDLRQPNRRNGQEGPGPFTLTARKDILRRLFEAEVEVGIPLISFEEKQEIQRLWMIDNDAGDTVAQIEQQTKVVPSVNSWFGDNSERCHTLVNLPIFQAETNLSH